MVSGGALRSALARPPSLSYDAHRRRSVPKLPRRAMGKLGAMGKRRNAAAPAAAPGVGAPAKPDDSAFERLSHRRHFDVLGRKCVSHEARQCVPRQSRHSPPHNPMC